MNNFLKKIYLLKEYRVQILKNKIRMYKIRINESTLLFARSHRIAYK